MKHLTIVSVVAAFALSGCAPGSSYEGPERPTEVMRGGQVIESDEPEARTVVVDAPVEKVWPVLSDAYKSLGIPVQHVDHANRVIGNRQTVITRDLGGQRASEYFDCGRTVTGAEATDQYRIQADITTQVTARAEGGTELSTSVLAMGRPPQGASMDMKRCWSTGELEERIAEYVTGRVGATVSGPEQ